MLKRGHNEPKQKRMQGLVVANEKLRIEISERKQIEDELRILNTITQAVHQSLDLEEVYNVALDMTVALENIDMAMIYLVDDDRKEAVLQAQRNTPEDYIQRAGRIPYPKGITWKVINSGEIINIEDAQKNPDIGPAGRDLGHHGILGIPITLEGRTIGVIWFISYKERKFSRHEVDFLSSIGNQVATAIAKAKLYRELSKKTKYETIISTVTQSVHQSIDLQVVLENAVEAMSRNINNVDAVGIYLIKGREAILRAYRGLPEWYLGRAGKISYPKGFIWKTIIEGKPIYCADVDRDTVIGPAGREAGIKSYVSMPIHSEGKSVGAIGINSFKKNAFDREELKLLENVAQQIEIAINNAKQAGELVVLYEDINRKNKDLEILNAITQAVHQSLDLQEVYRIALDKVIELENVDMACIHLVDEAKNEAVLQDHRNLPEEFIQRAARIPCPKGVTWKVINTGKILNVRNAEEDPDVGLAGRRLGFRSMLGIPIVLEGKTIGVIWLLSYRQHLFTKFEEELLTSTGNQIAIAIARANIYRELSKKNRYEAIISAVTRSVHQSINLQEVFQNAAQSISQNIDKVSHFAIYMVEGEEAVIKAHKGVPDWFIERAGRVPYPRGLTWKTIIEEKPRYCVDVDRDTVIGPAGKGLGIKSYLSVPLHFQGKTVGTMNIASFQRNAFDEDELKLLEIVARQIEVAISNAQKAEILRQSEERHRILFDQSPVGVYIFDTRFRITQCNERFVQILQSSYDKVIGFDLLRVKDQSFTPAMKKVLEGQSTHSEGYYEATTGSARLWLSVRFSPLLDADGSVIAGMAVVEDITERKLAEEEIKQLNSELERRVKELQSLFSIAPVGIAVALDPECKVITTNALLAKLIGVSEGENVSKNGPEAHNLPYKILRDGKELLPEELPMQKAVARRITVLNDEIDVLRADGTLLTLYGHAAPIINYDGSVIGCISTYIDITEHKQVEERIRKSLKEKEVLLKEIHHRVKNNLQIISSLLSLQSRRSKSDKETLDTLNECSNRIKSMALVHEQLYKSKNLGEINCAVYIQSLINNLFRSYGVPSSKIQLNIDIDDTYLDIDRAVPCGLIINELVSNSLKYAFPPGKRGKIYIGLNSHENGIFKLIVSDNGVGLPRDTDFRSTRSLGFKLINILTKQLEGTLDFHSNGGTVCEIKFRIE
ncbi:MAG TPA: GAF domain-containing protein [Thermodesulfobacteriota bacterium]|nr:GAF domain-containing protein [Thermodesulfobacteriota bacterium]